MTNKMILKTVAGSRAYGLETPESDWDYHAVFVTPTVDILALGANPKGRSWDESKEVDMQTWEVGHFPIACIKCYNKVDGKERQPEQKQGKDLRRNLRPGRRGTTSEEKSSSLRDSSAPKGVSQLRKEKGKDEGEVVECGTSPKTVHDLQDAPLVAGKETNPSTRSYQRGSEGQSSRKSSNSLPKLPLSNPDVRFQPQCTHSKVDTQSWEIGKFLFLATKCNPTILETFVAPLVGLVSGGYGYRLRNLLPAVLSKRYVRAAYLGYAHNQRAKLFNKPDDSAAAQPSERAWKFATQYLRVLIQGERLLRTGELVVNMGLYPDMIPYPDGAASPRSLLMDIRRGRFSLGDVIDTAKLLEERLEKAYDNTQLPNVADLERVNEFLIQVRKDFWT